MKKIFLFGALCIVTAVCIESCSPSKEAGKNSNEDLVRKSVPTQTVKMLSVNIAHQLQDKTSVKKFADWLKSTGAEVVSIQEIERPREGGEGFDAAAELAKRLDMRMYFGNARYFQGRNSGNALFSMYPIQQTNTFPMPTGKGKARRSLAFGVIDTGLRGIGFASTELDDESLAERTKQSYEIFSIANSLKEYPFVVGGDFAENANGKTTAKMKEKFSFCNILNAETSLLQQHIYVSSQSTITPIAAEKVTYGKTEAVLVTLQVQQ